MVNRLQALCQNIGSCRGPICTDISHSGRRALISDILAEDGRRAVVSDGLVGSRMVEGGASGREGEEKGEKSGGDRDPTAGVMDAAEEEEDRMDLLCYKTQDQTDMNRNSLPILDFFGGLNVKLCVAGVVVVEKQPG